MNFIVVKLLELQKKGWTLSAIADELEYTVNTVEKWKAGHRKPRYRVKVYALLDNLKRRKRVPKKRRYKKGRYPLE
jgi:hypothetical protein